MSPFFSLGGVVLCHCTCDSVWVSERAPGIRGVLWACDPVDPYDILEAFPTHDGGRGPR